MRICRLIIVPLIFNLTVKLTETTTPMLCYFTCEVVITNKKNSIISCDRNIDAVRKRGRGRISKC
jgi:hypothetical protein